MSVGNASAKQEMVNFNATRSIGKEMQEGIWGLTQQEGGAHSGISAVLCPSEQQESPSPLPKKKSSNKSDSVPTKVPTQTAKKEIPTTKSLFAF